MYFQFKILENCGKNGLREKQVRNKAPLMFSVAKVLSEW